MSRPRALVTVVTGAAGAIGGAIAEALLAVGQAVVLTDLDPKVERRARNLSPDRTLGIAFDILDTDARPGLIERTEARLGPITGLVNCAGIASTEPFLELDRERFERRLEVNLTASLLWTQAIARGMCERRFGRLVKIASISGLRAGIGRTAYGT
jgi:NAD(P)-dependent dehydrogenase (short-subunit alcohol dehydrogenase family)